MSIKVKILFMGTPNFAATVLNALIKSGNETVGVVSQPDRPKGRGHKLQPTETKVAAEAAGIKVFQPEKLKNGELREVLDETKPEIIVVAAYGKILPEYVLNYPKYGCINVHASLLPQLRGAAPIQRAIMNGDSETGITIMYLGTGLDTGDILSVEKTPIGEYETSGELFSRLADIGGKLVVAEIAKIADGTSKRMPQDESKATYAPMITKEDAKIDWTKSAAEISKLICAMNPQPMAYTTYNGEPMKIAAAKICDGSGKPGEMISIEKGKGLKVTCGEGALYLESVRFPESKYMNPEDYARGHKTDYTILT